MLDIEKFVGDIHQYMRQAIAPLVKRIEVLEDEIAERDAEPDALDIAEAVVCNEGFRELIRLQVAEFAKLYPVKDGEPGPKGDPGLPGFGLAGAMIDRDGHLVLSLSNGETKDVGPVVGRDAFALEDFHADFDLDAGLVLSLSNKAGEHKTVQIHLPIPIHRGYWRDGTRAHAGDLWTQDGSTWIARRNTERKPATEYKEDWTLVARKGSNSRAKSSVALNGS